MTITAIETPVYEEMINSFREFVKDIEQLCKPTAISNEWLDNQEVCQILDISKRSLQYYRDSGKLVCSRMGNKIYYRNKDVQALIDNSTTKKT